MAAYNFKHLDDSLDEVKEFMFGNLDQEVDIQAALKDGFIQDQLQMSGYSVSIEHITAEIRIVKFDQETMTGVIVVDDPILGEIKFVGTIEQI